MLTKSPEVGVDYTIPYDIRGSGDSVFPNTVEEDHDRGIKIKGWRKDELQLLLHKGLRRCRHNEENLDNEIETPDLLRRCLGSIRVTTRRISITRLKRGRNWRAIVPF